MRQFILVALAGVLQLSINHISVGQNLDIDFVALEGRNVVVHYTLDDGNASTRLFLVQMYSSQDNFTSPLTRVTGDFGEVTAGVDKKIVWDITGELGAFKGDISFELRGRVYVPFVRIQNMPEGKVFKRGKNYPISWISGNMNGQVNIELFNKAGERLWGENNVANIGKFDWYIPASIKKGKDYRLKFTNTRDRNDVAYTNTVAIRPKIPLLLKVATVIVAGVIADVVIQQSSATTAQTLPGPPSSPNN